MNILKNLMIASVAIASTQVSAGNNPFSALEPGGHSKHAYFYTDEDKKRYAEPEEAENKPVEEKASAPAPTPAPVPAAAPVSVISEPVEQQDVQQTAKQEMEEKIKEPQAITAKSPVNRPQMESRPAKANPFSALEPSGNSKHAYFYTESDKKAVKDVTQEESSRSQQKAHVEQKSAPSRSMGNLIQDLDLDSMAKKVEQGLDEVTFSRGADTKAFRNVEPGGGSSEGQM